MLLSLWKVALWDIVGKNLGLETRRTDCRLGYKSLPALANAWNSCSLKAISIFAIHQKMEVGTCGENVLKLCEVTGTGTLWMSFLGWGESIKSIKVLCLAQHVLPAIWHWCSSSQSGCGYAEVGRVVFWCGSQSQKHLLLFGYHQGSCREHQPLPCLQRKTPMFSQKSFDPHFAFALDTFSPPHNYVPPWFAFFAGKEQPATVGADITLALWSAARNAALKMHHFSGGHTRLPLSWAAVGPRSL